MSFLRRWEIYNVDTGKLMFQGNLSIFNRYFFFKTSAIRWAMDLNHSASLLGYHRTYGVRKIK